MADNENNHQPPNLAVNRRDGVDAMVARIHMDEEPRDLNEIAHVPLMDRERFAAQRRRSKAEKKPIEVSTTMVKLQEMVKSDFTKCHSSNFDHAVVGTTVDMDVRDDFNRNFVSLIPHRKSIFIVQTVTYSSVITLSRFLSNPSFQTLMDAKKEPYDDHNIATPAEIAAQVAKRDAILAGLGLDDRIKGTMDDLDVTIRLPSLALDGTAFDYTDRNIDKFTLEKEYFLAERELHMMQNTKPCNVYFLHWDQRVNQIVDGNTGLPIPKPSLASLGANGNGGGKKLFKYQDAAALDPYALGELEELETRVLRYLKEQFDAMNSENMEFHWFVTECGSSDYHSAHSVISKTCIDTRNELIRTKEGNMKELGHECGFLFQMPFCAEGMSVRFDLPNDAVENEYYWPEVVYVAYGSAIVTRADVPYADGYGTTGSKRLGAFIYDRTKQHLLQPRFTFPNTNHEKHVNHTSEDPDCASYATFESFATRYRHPQLTMLEARRPAAFFNPLFYGVKNGNKFRNKVFVNREILVATSAAELLHNFRGNIDVKSFNISDALETQRSQLSKDMLVTVGSADSNVKRFPDEIFRCGKNKVGVRSESLGRLKTNLAKELARQIPRRILKDDRVEYDTLEFPTIDQPGVPIYEVVNWSSSDGLIGHDSICGYDKIEDTGAPNYLGSKVNFRVLMHARDQEQVVVSGAKMMKYEYFSTVRYVMQHTTLCEHEIQVYATVGPTKAKIPKKPDETSTNSKKNNKKRKRSTKSNGNTATRANTRSRSRRAELEGQSEEDEDNDEDEEGNED